MPRGTSSKMISLSPNSCTKQGFQINRHCVVFLLTQNSYLPHVYNPISVVNCNQLPQLQQNPQFMIPKVQHVSHFLSLYRSNYVPFVLTRSKLQIPDSLPCSRSQLPIRDGNRNTRSNQRTLNMSLRTISPIPLPIYLPR
jgi:hypothetical protein